MSKDATLAQGNQVMNLILQNRLTAPQLQKLLSTGFLSRLLQAAAEGKIDQINHFEFRKALGDDDASKVCYHGTPMRPKSPEVSYNPNVSMEQLIKRLLPELPQEEVSYLGSDDYQERIGSSQPLLGLAVPNWLGMTEAVDYLLEIRFAPATRRELFTYIANMREKLAAEEFNGRIIAGGSRYLAGSEGYPFILLDKGVVKGSGILGKGNILSTGDYLLVTQR